ncbi:hypothetical protein [Dyella tabacisoli]|nr:hypothetical protein [Dyella tabacisoli]
MALLLTIVPVIASATDGPKPADSTLAFFRQLNAQPNELARAAYLTDQAAQLSPADRSIAMQLLAGAESELGLYNEAIRDFPLAPHLPDNPKLPIAAEWHVTDAVDTIANLVAKRRIVLINEAHHDAHTRQLTLALLPRLRTLGFTHFAAEALSEEDAALMQRGYPIATSGTEYLHEPLYGEIIRTAIRLGFVIVPYDSTATTVTEREAGQADHLYQKIFAKDSNARVFVHAGYAHIDKAKGRLDHTVPMAMHLQEATGIEPFSIDQTDFRDVDSGNEIDPYHQMIAAFHPQHPTVLLNNADGHAWSIDPKKFDVSVMLPLEVDRSANTDTYKAAWATFGMEGIAVKQVPHAEPRPKWLSLNGQRHPLPIDTALCAKNIPCVIEAHYAAEPDTATAADRYMFIEANTANTLYLFPGHYRLRAWGANGKTLGEKSIEL